MTGGLLQLVSYGIQDAILTLKPEFTYFKMVYYRYSNFSKTTNEVILDKKLSFDSVNSLTIPKNADLLDNLYMKVTLPSIEATYNNTTFKELYDKKGSINFLTRSEYQNLVYTSKNCRDYINLEDLYKVILTFTSTDNDAENMISHLININNIPHDIEYISKNIYYKLNNNIVNNFNLNSLVFKNFNFDSKIELNTNLNIIKTNFDLTNILSLYKSYYSCFYNNNFQNLLNYFYSKSQTFEINTPQVIIEKLYLKLLNYYTSEDANLLSLALLKDSTELNINTNLKNHRFIYQPKYIQISYNNITDINNLYIYNYKLVFLLNNDTYDNSSIKTILKIKYIELDVEDKITYELFQNNFEIGNISFLSNYLNFENWNTYSNSYSIISKNLKVNTNSIYEIYLDNIDNLKINQILFGFNYKNIYTTKLNTTNFLLGRYGITEGTDLFTTNEDTEIILETTDDSTFTITFDSSLNISNFIEGDVIEIQNGDNDTNNIYNLKYNGLWYINSISDNVLTIFGSENSFISGSSDKITCNNDPNISIKKYLDKTTETSFNQVYTDINTFHHYKIDQEINNNIVFRSSSNFNIKLETIDDGIFSIKFNNLDNITVEVGDIIKIENNIDSNSLWNSKYDGLWQIKSVSGNILEIYGLTSSFILNTTDDILCSNDPDIIITKYSIYTKLELGYIFDYALLINELDISKNMIECELFDNKMHVNYISYKDNKGTNDYNFYDLNYLHNGINYLESNNIEIINSDVWNNYLFIKNSTYNQIKKLTDIEYYENIITYSNSCINHHYKLLNNFINNLFIGYYYISCTFKVSSSTNVVDAFSHVFLLDNIFEIFKNNFLIKESGGYYSSDYDNCPEYIYNKFVNKIVNYYNDTKNFNNFKQIFVKGFDDIQDITNDNTTNDTINLLDKLNYLNTTLPFIFVKIPLNPGLEYHDETTIFANQIISIYDDINKSNFVGSFTIQKIITYNDCYILKICLNTYDQDTNNFSITSFDSFKENSYVYYNDESYIQISSFTLDYTEITFTFTTSVYVDFDNDSTGQTSTTTDIEFFDKIHIYYSLSEEFYEYHSTYMDTITMTGAFTFTIRPDSILNNLSFQTSTYTGIKYIYYVFLDDGNGNADFTKGAKIDTITETPRYFSILELDKIKSNGDYTELDLPAIIQTQHYHYCNIFYNMFLMYIYNEVKSSTLLKFNNIILNRVFLIASKIYRIISENSKYYSDGDPETFITNQKQILRITYFTDFTKIFNSNTILNELFNSVPEEYSEEYYIGLKTYLNNKTTTGGVTYKYENLIFTRSDTVIENTDVVIEFISYFKDILSQFNTSNYITNINELVGFEYSDNKLKQLYYVTALDIISYVYINIIDNYYFDDSDYNTNVNTGSRFYDYIKNSSQIQKNVIRNILEDTIVNYNSVHTTDFDIYINRLNLHYNDYFDKFNKFNDNYELINNTRIYNTNNLIGNISTLRTDIYNINNFEEGDNVEFDNILNNIFTKDEINRSINYFFNYEIYNSNDMYNFLNKFIFTIAINQINCKLEDFCNSYLLNKTISSPYIDTDIILTSLDKKYILYEEDISSIYIPLELNDEFTIKINYIRNLLEVNTSLYNIEKEIWNLEKSIYNHIKSYYFTSSNIYKSIKSLENYINTNILINDYKLIRGVIVTNSEYLNLNYKPLKLYINNINKNYGITSLIIPFNIRNLINSNNIKSINFSNPGLTIINDLYNTTFNINLRFGLNIKNNHNMIEGDIGIALNGNKIRSNYCNISPNDNIQIPDSIYSIEVQSRYYKNYDTNKFTNTTISVNDKISLYRTSLITDSNKICDIIITDVIFRSKNKDNTIIFSTNYNFEISEDVYGFKDVEINNYYYGFRIKKYTVENQLLNMNNFKSFLPNYNELYDSATDLNNNTVYYNGNFINELDTENNEYLNVSNYEGDFLRYPDGHSKIVGISIDGYPIYGPYGYENINNTSNVKLLRSSYILKNEFTENRLSLINSNLINNYNIGQLIDDYIYIKNLGDLDECNGRFCITPEFPYGTYAYFLTFKLINEVLEPEYPYVIGNKFYANPEMSIDVNTEINTISSYILNKSGSTQNVDYFVSSNVIDTNIILNSSLNGTFTITFGSTFGNISNSLFENDIIQIIEKVDTNNQLNKSFLGYWKIISISGMTITCKGLESLFNGTNINITCTNNPQVIITKYYGSQITDKVIDIDIGNDFKKNYILNAPGNIRNYNYFASSNNINEEIIIDNTLELETFTLTFGSAFNDLTNLIFINDIVEIMLSENDSSNKLIGKWKVNFVTNNKITLIGSSNDIFDSLNSYIYTNNPSLIIIKYNNANEVNLLKNNNIYFSDNEVKYEEGDFINFVGSNGKYGSGTYNFNFNNLPEIKIINDGIEYINNDLVYAFKNIPLTLEYVDDSKLFLRRKTRFSDGYYFNYDSDKLELLSPNVTTQDLFNTSLYNVSNILTELNRLIYDNTEPILDILTDSLIQILNLDDVVIVLGSVLPEYFTDTFKKNLFEYIDNNSNNFFTIIETINEKISQKYCNEYKIYYDNDIYIKKDISYFKLIYSLNSQLSNYFNISKFNNLKSLSSNIDISLFRDDLISAHNDIISYLSKNYTNNINFNINKIPIINRDVSPNFAWIKNIGNYIFDYIELYFNDLLIDKQYSDWINIWHELNNSYDKKNVLDKLIGNINNLIEINNKPKPSTNLIIPLKFWFCRYSGLNIPLIALQNTNIIIKFKISAFRNLIRKNDDTSVNINEGFNMSLLADYIYLDDKEKELFGKSRHEYLIEQVQFNGRNDIFNLNKIIKINFSNCIKDIYYIIDYNKNLFEKDRSNYSLNVSTNSGNPILSTKLIVNNINIFNQNGIYTNYIIPYESYKNTPSDGVNILKFEINGNNFQPSGALNFSMYNNVNLELNIDESYLVNKNKVVKIFANGYNILRIMGGQAGLAFI